MKKYYYAAADLLSSIALTLFVLCLCVELTFQFKPLYYFDITNLSITSSSNLSKQEIMKNYNYIISYVTSIKNKNFDLPTVSFTKQAAIHFEQVREILQKITVILIISLLVLVLLKAFHMVQIYIFKWCSMYIVFICILLIIPFIINFDKTFDFFHEVTFKNTLWLFDPLKDPIINIFPEEFFLHAALLMLALWLFSGIFLYYLYRSNSVH